MLKQHESELLSAYMDKELSDGELTLVQEFLATSVEWREELEKLQKTKHLAMTLPTRKVRGIVGVPGWRVNVNRRGWR